MKCPTCGSNSIVHDKQTGERICTRCGLVILEKEMDRRPEWHSEPGDNNGRADMSAGSDLTQHDLGLGSKLGDSSDLSPAWRSKLRRLKKWHKQSRATNYEEKSLRKALIKLDKFCEDLFLPKSLKAEVSSIYRKAKRRKVTPGRDTWLVLAALVFSVARIRGVPRTEKEIVKVLQHRLDGDRREVLKGLRRTRRALMEELGLEVPRPSPKEYIDRFSSRLGIRQETIGEAYRICNNLPDSFKNRKASFLVTAAIIYNASRKSDESSLRIRDVAEELDVGVSSLSKTGKKIRKLLSDHQE